MLYIGFLFCHELKIYVSRLRKQLELQTMSVVRQHLKPLLWLCFAVSYLCIGYFRGSTVSWVLLPAECDVVADGRHGYHFLPLKDFRLVIPNEFADKKMQTILRDKS